MPSDTTAESSDSIAPSIAIANAGAARSATVCRDTEGRCGDGNPALIAPNRLPIVSTGMWNTRTVTVAAISATNGAGTRRLTRGQSMRTSNVPADSAAAGQLMAPTCWAKAIHLSMKLAGTAPICSPRRSLTWLEKMMTAIPDVNPMIRGKGMNLIAAPNRASPKPISTKPAMIVATVSPSIPYFWTIP